MPETVAKRQVKHRITTRTKTISKIGNSQGILFDAALMDLARARLSLLSLQEPFRMDCILVSSSYFLVRPMAAPEQSHRSGISAEALTGLGITIAALGFLSLLLGTAEHFRSVRKVSLICYGLGAVLIVLGSIIAAAARIRARR